jgi:hypothetical protein
MMLRSKAEIFGGLVPMAGTPAEACLFIRNYMYWPHHPCHYRNRRCCCPEA